MQKQSIVWTYENYGNKQLRCVKCTRKQNMLECNRKINQPKCSNCYGPHPATYRNCIVAKELQKNNLISRTIPSGEMYENFNLNKLTNIVAIV